MIHPPATFVSVLAALLLSSGVHAQAALDGVLVASGFNRPTCVTTPRGDFTRMFVVELTGKIRIVENGSVLPTPFLDLSSTVQQGNQFQGLFGLTFHPDYWNNGYFYVYYAGLANNAVLQRFQVTADPNVADPGSGFVVLDIPEPVDGHEGGTVAFGPDGYLYLALGDGGSQNDPNCNGQNGQTLYSKMLRIDVDGGSPYAIPSDNPFVGDPNVLDETWSMGLRHPWRFSFDQLTGDLYIGDNGQETIEEIIFEPGGFAGGRNYGWPVMEGSQCFALNNCSPGLPACGAPDYTPALYEYDHTVGCSVIGGIVYRGCAIPGLQGTYFYADFCGQASSGGIFSFRYQNGQITEFQDRTSELKPPGLSIRQISGFGADGFGELYVLDHSDGELFKIVPQVPPNPDCNANGIPDACDLALGAAADCNANGIPDACDLASGTSTDFDANGLPDDCDPLSVDLAQISLAAGGTQTFRLDAGSANAGAIHLLLGTTAGVSPGQAIPGTGLTLPLNPGAYYNFTLLKAGQFIIGALGLLDGSGQQTASVTFPPGMDPVLAGVQFHHAYALLTFPTFSPSFVSNAVPLTLVP